MITGFKFNGKDFGEYGIMVNKCSPAQSSVQQYETIEIPGRAEKLKIFSNTRSNVQIIAECTIIEPGKIREIYSAFQGEGRFIHRDESDKYYRAAPEIITPQNIALYMNTMTITFDCNPFAYAVEDLVYQTNKKEFFINNLGSFYAQPVYRLNGTGTLTLEVNDDSDNKLIIPNIKDFCIVDAEKLLVHKDNVIMTSKGQIPFMAVGSNKVVTNADSIEIMMNTRWL